MIMSAAWTLASTLFTSVAIASDCTHLWQHDLSTGNVLRKNYTGDTNAAYAPLPLNYFRKDGYLRISGEFQPVRFFSIETYTGRKNKSFDVLHDFMIVPESGADVSGHSAVGYLPTSERFEIVIARESTVTQLRARYRNVLALKDNISLTSAWLRYFLPANGKQISTDDLPRVEMLSVKDHSSLPCPQTRQEVDEPAIPDFISNIVRRKNDVFKFKVADVNWAGNAGVGGYAYGHSRMRKGDVFVSRFKTPDVLSDVRYWSYCTKDLINNKGLACLPDSEARPDASGFVTVVTTSNAEAAAHAKQMGWAHLPDTRPDSIKMVFHAYRNILATEEFANRSKFKGEYLPKAVLCYARDFIDGSCDL